MQPSHRSLAPPRETRRSWNCFILIFGLRLFLELNLKGIVKHDAGEIALRHVQFLKFNLCTKSIANRYTLCISISDKELVN